MNHKDFFLIGSGSLLVIGGLFIHVQLASILDQQMKKLEDPALQKELQNRARIVRAVEGFTFLLGAVLLVVGLVGPKLNHP